MDPPEKLLIAITQGDPAGIGPEIIARGWNQFPGSDRFRSVVFGRPVHLRRAVEVMNLDLPVIEVASCAAAREIDASGIVCIPSGSPAADQVRPGRIEPDAGDAAFQFIDDAIAATISGQADGIVTAPINKMAIRMADHEFPGHTEILANRCGCGNFAMMLYVPPGQQVGGDIGLGVVHTTLHQSLRSALAGLTTDKIMEKIRLAWEFAEGSLRQAGVSRLPRIAVAALNPHAGEQGLFGNEESEIIEPAIQRARARGHLCTGPFSCDSLMGRAAAGEFDVVVAMYHDQGHIALKLLGMHKAVNVTLGLPIVRTSVAHGTAFEIAGTGQADCTSLIRALDVAQHLVQQRKSTAAETPAAIDACPR